jgi:hypothetical protein
MIEKQDIVAEEISTADFTAASSGAVLINNLRENWPRESGKDRKA